jgi:hypothetical protein
MDSERVTVTSSNTTLGTGLVKKIQIKQETGSSFLHVGNSSQTVPLEFNLLTLEGARGRAFDLSDYRLSGNGQVILWKWAYTAPVSSVNVETYNASDNFKAGLDAIFDDDFLSCAVSYTATGQSAVAIRGCIEDEVTVVGEGEMQYQQMLKTATFKIDDLPTGFAVGDTMTIEAVTWYVNEVLERDAYTVKFYISKNSR